MLKQYDEQEVSEEALWEQHIMSQEKAMRCLYETDCVSWSKVQQLLVRPAWKSLYNSDRRMILIRYRVL
jgi:hypothetical protein